MAVVRIVPDLTATDPAKTAAFYTALFDLKTAMDMSWIVTLTGDGSQTTQMSIASEGGSGAPVPALSIEVDDLQETYARAKTLNAEITYPLTDEPWGVGRFFIRDPDGRLVNILSHIQAES